MFLYDGLRRDSKWPENATSFFSGYTLFLLFVTSVCALSQVCSSVRGPMERHMYQYIQVNRLNFGWWDQRREPLLLLLRTLRDRPDLRQYVRTVYINNTFTGNIESESTALSLTLGANFRNKTPFAILFEYCSSIRTLVVKHYQTDNPKKILQRLSSVREFATWSFPSIFHVALESFEGLEGLYIKFQIGPLPDLPPQHNLKNLRLDDLLLSTQQLSCTRWRLAVAL
jgi:hypothetical protein